VSRRPPQQGEADRRSLLVTTRGRWGVRYGVSYRVAAGRPRNCIPDNVPTGLAPKPSEKLGSNTFLVVRLPFARPALVKYGRGSIASPLHHRPLLGRTITWKCRCGSRR